MINIDVSKKLDTYFQQYKNRKYKIGEILLQADDEPAGLFYLKEGIVRQYAITVKGKELTINVFKPGSLFPLAWIVNDTISPHFFEAITPVAVWIAPKREVLEYFKQESDILWDLIKRIYRGLDGYFTRMEHSMVGNAQARLIVELLIYAKRFGEQKNGQTKIGFKLTEQNIAAQSGIARETVSREIQKLRQKRLINFEKNTLIIYDLSKLEKEL